MKKLIAISVVFALVAGVAFAADVSGTVEGKVNVLEGNTGKDSKVTASAQMVTMRVEASGETDDGDFGGWVRLDPANFGLNMDAKEDENPVTWDHGVHAYAWWKPIDLFKMTIGGNPDGFFGKAGLAGWSFYEGASGLVANPGNAWGGGYQIEGTTDISANSAFYPGFGGNGLLLNIYPAEIVDINIVLPFFDGTKNKDGDENLVADKFKKLHFQLDFHLDFGNIAVSYLGNLLEAGAQPTVFGSYSNSFGDLSLDFGVGFTFPDEGYSHPIYVGVGLKYALESFGVKFRTIAGLGGDDKQTNILADVLPFFVISDSLKAFVSVGIAMAMGDGVKAAVGDSSALQWHFNPYLEVGTGPKFLVGIQASSKYKAKDGSSDLINWAVPIALTVSF